MSARAIVVLVVVTAVLGGLGTAPADATAQGPADTSQYIVSLRGVPTAAVPGEARQLASTHGGDVVDVYQHALSGFTARMTGSEARALANDPSVAAVVPDGIVHAATTESPAPWNLDRIDQHTLPLDDSYTTNETGASVHAYVVDTGIRITHQDFGGRASVGDDEVNDGHDGIDCNGHGTHVAGTLGGATYGVAKAVSLVSVRVLDCTGTGTDSEVIAGIDWVTAHAVEPAVANLSLDGEPNPLLDQAVESSIASGVTYAIAAGNSGTDACGFSPADVPDALTVGATDMTDTRASFSDEGSCVKLFAPGVNVTSDWDSSDTATNVLNGTSMATPIVAGSAALYLGAHPTSTPAQVMSALTSSATAGVVVNPGPGSPNLLDYVGSLQSAHPGVVLTAVGTGATASLTDGVLGTDPAFTNYDDANFDVGDPPPSPVTVPSDASCASVTYASAASPSSVAAPDGSDAGRDELRGSVAGTYPDPTSDAGRGCVDIARSDLPPRPVGPDGDNASFEYYAFALDAVTWASPSLNAPANLTVAQLRAIYNCTDTDWSQVGGSPGQIQRFLPQASSGTRKFFISNVLAGADPTTVSTPSCPAVIQDIEENTGTDLYTPNILNPTGSDATFYQQAILPYSAGKFVFQATNSTNPSLDVRGGVRPGGLVPTTTGAPAVYPVRWTGSAWLLNNATVVGGTTVTDAVTNGGTGTPPPSPVVTSASANFTTTATVGQTVQGTNIPAGAVITSIDSATQIHISIPTLASATGGTLTWGAAVVSEFNPNLTSSTNTTVFPGVRYLYDVVDTTEPSYPQAVAVVGFQDSPGGMVSPLCQGTDASTVRANGFLDLAALTSPGGNTNGGHGVTCRRQTP
jgi:subtilisin family serine protease